MTHFGRDFPARTTRLHVPDDYILISAQKLARQQFWIGAFIGFAAGAGATWLLVAEFFL